MNKFFFYLCLIALLAIPCFSQDPMINTFSTRSIDFAGGASGNGSGGMQVSLKPVKINKHIYGLLEVMTIDQGKMFVLVGGLLNTKLSPKTEFEIGATIGCSAKMYYRPEIESPLHLASGLSLAIRSSLSEDRKVTADLEIINSADYKTFEDMFWYKGQATVDVMSFKGNGAKFVVGAGVTAIRNLIIGPKLQFNLLANADGGAWVGYGYSPVSKEKLMAFQFTWKIPF